VTRTKHLERNIAICNAYTAGAKVPELARTFEISIARVYQILHTGIENWSVKNKSERTEFVGVNVTPMTKEALEQKAVEEGTSVSKLASDVLDTAVKVS